MAFNFRGDSRSSRYHRQQFEQKPEPRPAQSEAVIPDAPVVGRAPVPKKVPSLSRDDVSEARMSPLREASRRVSEPAPEAEGVAPDLMSAFVRARQAYDRSQSKSRSIQNNLEMQAIRAQEDAEAAESTLFWAGRKFGEEGGYDHELDAEKAEYQKSALLSAFLRALAFQDGKIPKSADEQYYYGQPSWWRDEQRILPAKDKLREDEIRSLITSRYLPPLESGGPKRPDTYLAADELPF